MRPRPPGAGAARRGSRASARGTGRTARSTARRCASRARARLRVNAQLAMPDRRERDDEVDSVIAVRVGLGAVSVAEPDRDALGKPILVRVTDGVGDADRADPASVGIAEAVEKGVRGHGGSLPVGMVTALCRCVTGSCRIALRAGGVGAGCGAGAAERARVAERGAGRGAGSRARAAERARARAAGAARGRAPRSGRVGRRPLRGGGSRGGRARAGAGALWWRFVLSAGRGG